MSKETLTQEQDHWQDAFREGDKDAFHTLAEREEETLINAARRGLEFYVRQGYLHADDFTPEEIAGQTLIYAWDHREQCPDGMTLRGWLLGTEYRVLRGMAAEQKQYRDDKDVSLDEEVTSDDPSSEASQEWFWEWYQPDAELYLEDTVGGRIPDDAEIDLDEEKDISVGSDSDAWHALMLHDEFDMSVSEVAFTMSRDVDRVSRLIQRGRSSMRDQLPDRLDVSEMDQPAPPEGSDEADRS